jgi:hypothetical protein
VAPERELRLDPLLQSRQAKLVEALDIDPGKRLEFEIGERSAAPEQFGLAQLRHSPRWIGVLERLPTLGDKLLEPVQIELSGLDAEDVARRARYQSRLVPSWIQRLAEARDLDAQCVVGRLASLLSHQLVDQPVARDDAVGAQEQDCEQRALLRPAQEKRFAVAANLERAEDAEVESSVHAAAVRIFPQHPPFDQPPRLL